MNYRHAFHAGNFADCMKHALLVWLLRAMARKEAGFFVLDTHAGAGAYELAGGAAQRTGEWREGIGRLLSDSPETLADYVGLIRALNPPAGGKSAAAHPSPNPLPQGEGEQSGAPSPCGRELGAGTVRYPGSPVLIGALLRAQDRLACCELHPEDAAALRRRFAADRQVSVHRRDGWEALGALLPPRERRGLVLIDPPYERPGEFAALAAGLRRAHARFPAGVYAAWYPIKHRAPARGFHAALRESGLRDVVAAELLLREPVDPARLNGCGLLVVNPPWRFEEAARPILGALLERLGAREPGEAISVIRLADE